MHWGALRFRERQQAAQRGKKELVESAPAASRAGSERDSCAPCPARPAAKLSSSAGKPACSRLRASLRSASRKRRELDPRAGDWRAVRLQRAFVATARQRDKLTRWGALRSESGSKQRRGGRGNSRARRRRRAYGSMPDSGAPCPARPAAKLPSSAGKPACQPA